MDGKFFLIELIFMVLVAIFVYFISLPRLISPPPGFVVNDQDFSFVVRRADSLLISSSPDFQYPVVLEGQEEVTLHPGFYYWKAVSFFRESEIRNFTIVRDVVLHLNAREAP